MKRARTGVDMPFTPAVAVALVASVSFLRHRARHHVFDPNDAEVALWTSRGGAMQQWPTIHDAVAAVSSAWPIEVGQGGGVAMMAATGAVVFFTESERPLVFRGALPLVSFDNNDDDDEVCVPLRLRAPRPPRVFPVQKDALALADMLPPGFLMVWARDVGAKGAKGAKQYLVASADDFWPYYAALPAAQRNHYEVIRRVEHPVCFVADLEYKLKWANNRELQPRALVGALQTLVQQLWLEETGAVLDPRRWLLYDSSTFRNEELLPEEEERYEDAKVSFHLLHPDAVFRDLKLSHGAFCARLEERAPPELFVQSTKEGDQVFFLDRSIYSANRCLRLVYSTKAGEMRFLLPVGGVAADLNRDAWEQSLVTLERPTATVHPLEVQEAVVARSMMVMERARPSAAPAAAAADEGLLGVLATVVQRHFQPDRMRDVTLEDNGICTLSMVLHDCREICNDRHNNQVYAVADLKRRVFYAKCHADRTRKGPDHAFPAELEGLTLVPDDALVPGGVRNLYTLPADSAAAHGVLRFCRAIFGSAGVASRIPEPGAVALVYHAAAEARHYDIALGTCDSDGGELHLMVCQTGASIRCVGGASCSRRGWRLQRPTRGSPSTWDLCWLLPKALPLPLVDQGDLDAPQRFLAERNLFAAIGFGPLGIGEGGLATELYADRLSLIRNAANDLQRQAPPAERNEQGVHVLAARLKRKVSIMEPILLNPEMETVYRECLTIASDFDYPLELIPKGPRTLLVALTVHLARNRGYKRVGDDFYVPANTAEGFVYYEAVPLAQLLTRVCAFETAPNLCSLLWTARASGDMEHMLRDENHWPSVPPSKRYLGFRNGVYDLVDNAFVSWDHVQNDPAAIPFNCLANVEFPAHLLEQARQGCPVVRVTDDGVHFSSSVRAFVATPLFDQPMLDQGFDEHVMAWIYALFGRMFHRVGKAGGGDNWEIVPCSLGAPSTFKSSIITLLQSYLQPTQFGVMATQTEQRFPIAALVGKLMVFLPEAEGCDLNKELLKQMASGDPVTAAAKFQRAANLPQWDVPMWFAGNGFLACRDVDGSVARRFAVFPHTRLLRPGQGDTALVQRIIEHEQAALLIKCNTLYLAMKLAIRQPVHLLLPRLVRAATQQALMENDPLHKFLVQECVVEPNVRIQWTALFASFAIWCRASGARPDAVSPHSPAVQTLVANLGARFHTRRGHPWIINLRLRDMETDEPFHSVFAVASVRRNGDADNDDDSWSSE